MERKTRIILTVMFSLFLTLQGCSTTPASDTNGPTGSAAGAAVGAVAGGAGAALFGASKPVIGLAALGGAALGYYVTTQRYASGGIIQAGGSVYTLGDYVGIEIPSDAVFEPNSADFTPEAAPILQSAVSVLNRYPDSNVMVSGNTSGFSTARYEQKLSEARAKQVAGFLWANGITSVNKMFEHRKLTYVGYGSYMPIANNIRNDGIRSNSRIQITAYPSSAKLKVDKRQKVFSNVGQADKPTFKDAEPSYGNEFSGDNLPESASTQIDSEKFRDYSSVSSRAPQHTDYYQERGNGKGAAWKDDNTIIGERAAPSARQSAYKDENLFAGYK